MSKEMSDKTKTRVEREELLIAENKKASADFIRSIDKSLELVGGSVEFYQCLLDDVNRKMLSMNQLKEMKPTLGYIVLRLYNEAALDFEAFYDSLSRRRMVIESFLRGAIQRRRTPSTPNVDITLNMNPYVVRHILEQPNSAKYVEDVINADRVRETK